MLDTGRKNKVIDDSAVVLDIGKTNTKATLWDVRGGQLNSRSRANVPQKTAHYRSLDVNGIDQFIIESLTEFAHSHNIRRIIPVGHGAAAALLQNGQLFATPMDYEDDAEDNQRKVYEKQRDAFTKTGSPRLPLGLNLGFQLHCLEASIGILPEDVTILPWPQYWAWRLCGTASSEVSSLGCHTDLWRSMENKYSRLAIERGWDRRMAPLKNAGQILSAITPEIAAKTGLPIDCKVLCGIHDSNAALLAARGHPEFAEQDATVLSTGTWFVAMRSIAPGTHLEIDALQESKDCLINVDIAGNSVPSARFMGGREVELIAGLDSFSLTDNSSPSILIERLIKLIANNVYLLPTFSGAAGPYPNSTGGWENEPNDVIDRHAITGLYLALMTDTILGLIGSKDHLLIEGRFAKETVFIRALATLRPQQKIYVSNADNDVAYGALRLVSPDLPPQSKLTPVMPLDIDLQVYAETWRKKATQEALH